MPSTALVTIGLTRSDGHRDENDGIYWSLSLSHYRYYGGAVSATSDDGERFALEELHMVALGSLFGRWRASRSDPVPAAQWFYALLQAVAHLVDKDHWLAILGRAARRLLNSTGDVLKVNCALLDFGYRRGSNLLIDSSLNQPCLPWFGLRMAHILSALSQPSVIDCGIQYLREIVKTGGLSSGDALISIIKPGKDDKSDHIYATAAPHLRKIFRSEEELSFENVPPLESDVREKGKQKTDDSDSESSFKGDIYKNDYATNQREVVPTHGRSESFVPGQNKWRHLVAPEEKTSWNPLPTKPPVSSSEYPAPWETEGGNVLLSDIDMEGNDEASTPSESSSHHVTEEKLLIEDEIKIFSYGDQHSNLTTCSAALFSAPVALLQSNCKKQRCNCF